MRTHASARRFPTVSLSRSLQRRGATILVFLVAAIVFLGIQPHSASAAPSPSGATIASDQSDYSPGATVTLSGAGWVSGEQVHINVNDDSSQSWSLDSNPDPVADPTGSFTFVLTLPNYFVANYSVIATGPTSGIATTTFTDALGRAVDWTQCRNDNGGGTPVTGGTGNNGVQDPCNWVPGSAGTSNAIYSEGDVVPQRAIQSVPTAAAHFVTFDHSFYDSSKGAYTYDLWATPSFTLGDDGTTNHLNLTPCNDIPTTGSNFGDLNYTNCLALYNGKVSYTLPTESTYVVGGTTYTYPHVAAAETNAAADGVTRNLWISCGQITGNGQVTVSAATQCTGVTITILGHGDNNKSLLAGSLQQGPPSSDDFVQMKVAFTTPFANEYVAIWTGGHLAKSSFWNDASFGSFQKLGAASAAGSSFHERLIGWDDNSSVGNQDNQVQAGVVVAAGSLTVIKDDLKNSGTIFPFTANSPLSPTSFNLCDPSQSGCPTSQSFSSLPAGTYTVAESVPAGWVLKTHTCTSTNSTSTYTYSTFGVAITLQPGDSVTCTFTNDTSPTNVVLARFSVKVRPTGAKLHWQTGTEFNVVGYNVWKRAKSDGKFVKLNATLIRSKQPGQLFGDTYSYRDTKTKSGKTYWYKVEVVGVSGHLEESEILQVRIP